MQTPWLTAFLRPVPDPPGRSTCGCPGSTYGKADERAPRETTEELANYFAARDGAEFPYQAIPEREQGYLAELETKHTRLPRGGLDDDDARGRRASSATRSASSSRPAGRRSSTAPTSARSPPVPARLPRASGSPTRRLVPYTAMPQNIAAARRRPSPVPKTFEDQPLDMVKAIRDTLLNYVNAVEQQLAGAKPAGASQPGSPAAASPTKPTGSSE